MIMRRKRKIVIENMCFIFWIFNQSKLLKSDFDLIKSYNLNKYVSHRVKYQIENNFWLKNIKWFNLPPLIGGKFPFN